MNAKEDFRQQSMITITCLTKTNIVIYLLPFILLVGSINQGHTQKQLDVQGQINSEDTVMVVRVNSNSMFTDVVGLDVFSHPAPGRGIGGSFYGGSIGLKAEGRQTALFGESQNDWGIYATSEFGSAGYFRGGDGDMDIVLGGSNWAGSTNNDEGVIGISASKPSGDLWLVSNDEIQFELNNNDDNETGSFHIRNGANETIFRVFENGNVQFKGQSTKTIFSSFDVGSANGIQLNTANSWTAIGTSRIFMKTREDTNIDLNLHSFGYGQLPVQNGTTYYEIRVDGNVGEISVIDLKKGNLGADIFLRSVFTNLTSGNHTVQVYAKVSNAPATSVRIDQFDALIVEEK